MANVVVVGRILCHEVLNELDVRVGRSLQPSALPLLLLLPTQQTFSIIIPPSHSCLLCLQ